MARLKATGAKIEDGNKLRVRLGDDGVS
jgi:hypothetical protein